MRSDRFETRQPQWQPQSRAFGKQPERGFLLPNQCPTEHLVSLR